MSALSCAVGVSLLWCFAFVVGKFTSCFEELTTWRAHQEMLLK